MIGAFFQCFKQPYATIKSLEAFRNIYPDSTVVLVSDNGYDYSNLAKEYKCIYIYNDKRSGVHGLNAYPSDFQLILNNFKNYISLIKEKYFILLEDDVHILKEIDISLIKYTINGNCINKIPNKALSFFNINNGGSIASTYYTGHGGSIFSTYDLLEIMNNKENCDYLINNWTEMFHEKAIIDLDIFLSCLVYISGKSVGHLECHCDVITNSYLVGNSKISIYHQYRDYYNKEIPHHLKDLVKLD